MHFNNRKRTVIVTFALVAGLIAACQNQPRVLSLKPVQVASTEIKDPPASTPNRPPEVISEPAVQTPEPAKTTHANEPPTVTSPENSAVPSEPPAPAATPELAKDKSQPDLFAEIAKVLQHPRCLNCHVSGDTPKQGDDRRDHMPPVKRGPDGRGSGLTCNVCHQSSNGPVAPGAPDWHLAPVSMAWEGFSAGELCRSVTDLSKNGGRDLKALATHLTTDPIVQWGWEPGSTRKPIPVSKAEFAKFVNAWVEGGGACP